VSVELDAETRAGLEEERRFLLDSLRDLEREHDAGDLGEDDYAALKDDYTARAASVLRKLEGAEQPAGAEPRAEKPAPPPAGGPAAGSLWKRRRGRILTVAVIAAVAIGAGVSVATFAGQRVDTPTAAEPPSSETARHLIEAQRLETEGKALEALKEYDEAIKADGSNVVALTYRGWLLARAGLTDPALASLDQALALSPGYPDAHFFRGMVLYQGRNDPAAAITEFETYLASNPPPAAADAVRGVLERARGDLAGTAPPGGDPAAPPASAPAPDAPPPSG
jgi:tetratricopeptide (TPR) repeat protein